MLRNKRGQIGETLTWTIALVVIVVMLVISIYLASLMVKPNEYFLGKYGGGKFFPQPTGIDLFAQQSLISFLNTGEGSGKIYGGLKSSGDFNDYNGNLAYKIFNVLYGSYYNSGVYLGFYNPSSLVNLEKNKYFGSAPSQIVRSGLTGAVYARNGASESIFLEGEEFLEMILVKGENQ